MTIKFDINAAVAAEVATGPDMTKAVKGGGGERTVAAAGPTRLRLVGYIETGKHKKTIKGKDQEQDQVQIVFELSGKNHPKVEYEQDGVKKSRAQKIVVTEKKSLNEKANFFKLFKAMNWQGKATHMAQLLGEAFLGEVSHYKFKGTAGDDVVIPQLRGDNGYTIRPPRLIDPSTEEVVTVNVDAQTLETQLYFWNTPSKDMWDSLFIDGTYEERTNDKGEVTAPAKSKNAIQLRIRSAVNFDGSATDTLLKTNGVVLDLPTTAVDDESGPAPEDESGTPATQTTKPAVTGKAATDALNGIV